MQIEIDPKMITEALDKAASEALRESLSGYKVQEAISSVITAEIAEGAISKAIKQAAKQVDIAALTQKLAAELQKATVKAAIALLQDGLVATVCKLRGIGEYGADDKAERAKVRVELFGPHKETVSD